MRESHYKNVCDINHRITNLVWSLAKLVTRLKDERWTKKILNWRPKDPNRSRGKSPKSRLLTGSYNIHNNSWSGEILNALHKRNRLDDADDMVYKIINLKGALKFKVTRCNKKLQ